MYKNQVWAIISRTDQIKPLNTRWTLKKKNTQNAEFRACLVAKGFAQIYGKDFNEICSLVTTLDNVRTVIARVTGLNRYIYQLM